RGVGRPARAIEVELSLCHPRQVVGGSERDGDAGLVVPAGSIRWRIWACHGHWRCFIDLYHQLLSGLDILSLVYRTVLQVVHALGRDGQRPSIRRPAGGIQVVLSVVDT